MLEKPEIYLDFNAGAPLQSEVTQALLRLFEHSDQLGNPASAHSYGRRAKHLISTSVQQVLRSLNLKPNQDDQIAFALSGTHANQWAIRSALVPLLSQSIPPHWILSQGEHPSVLEMAEWFRDQGGEVDLLPLLKSGEPDLSTLDSLYRPSATGLLSLIWVNHETGVITDVARAQKWALERGVALHLDAVQAWGKLPLELSTLGADWVSFSGHKIGAPSGIGMIWAKNPRLIDRRSSLGTQNILGIVALGTAAELLGRQEASDRQAIEQSRDGLARAILDQVAETRINGETAPRVANTLNLTFKDLKGEGLVSALDIRGIAVSAGPACKSGVSEPSTVLSAMGHSRQEALSSIRISLGSSLTSSQIAWIADTIEECVTLLRKASLSERSAGL